MSFFRNLHLSSRVLLGLFAVAVGVAVGGEVLRPGHHVHVGAGGHHHHWFLGPHVHDEQSTTATLSHRHDIHCDLAGAHAGADDHAEGHHRGGSSGNDAETHRDLPDDQGPKPAENDDGAFVDAFPLEEPSPRIVLGTSFAEYDTSVVAALTKRSTAPPFLPISPRGPPVTPRLV